MTEPTSIVRSSLIGYSLLFVVSLVLGFWQDRLGTIFGFPGWTGLRTHAFIGVSLAVVALFGGYLLRRNFSWAQGLDAQFRTVLTPIGFRDVCVLALSSGVVEETFFRAIIQPVFGIWATSFAFGLLHYPMNRQLIPWTMLAVLMGFAFGLVYHSTESLVAVALAHSLINFFELLRINREPLSGIDTR